MKTQNDQVYYDPIQKPVIIPKPTSDAFLAEDNPGDLIALYHFYYYTAKWQKTNQPRATVNYCMKGLKWGRQKFTKARDKLIELGLIEKIEHRNREGLIVGHYTKLNFIWSSNKEDSIQMYQNPQVDDQMYQNPQVDESTSGKRTSNALSSIKGNALSSIKENSKDISYDISFTTPSEPYQSEMNFYFAEKVNEHSVKKEKVSASRKEEVPVKHPDESPSEKPLKKSDSKKQLNSNDPVEKIIVYWNDLPKTTRHKLDPESKTHKLAKKYLSRLLEGKPLLHTKDGRPTRPLLNFLAKHGINEKYLWQKWTEREIKYFLKKIHEEMFRSDTKYDLPSTLWNGFAQKTHGFSYFYFKVSDVEIDDNYLSMARKLSEVVNPQIDKSRLFDWSRNFQQFTSKTNGNRQEMERQIDLILDWYKEHIYNPYVPQATDAKEFIEKYEKIVRAKKRQENKSEKSLQDKPSNWYREKAENRNNYSF